MVLDSFLQAPLFVGSVAFLETIAGRKPSDGRRGFYKKRGPL